MNLELRRVFEDDGARFDFDYEFSLGDEMIPSPVRASGFVKNSSGIVSLSAKVRFTVVTQCAKCAKPVTKELTIESEHLLASHLNNEDNDDYILVEDMKLKLDDLLSEDIYLSLPSRFLCSDNCLGLCPYCGKDLNEGNCACKKAADPRLSSLLELLNNDEQI